MSDTDRELTSEEKELIRRTCRDLGDRPGPAELKREAEQAFKQYWRRALQVAQKQAELEEQQDELLREFGAALPRELSSRQVVNALRELQKEEWDKARKAGKAVPGWSTYARTGKMPIDAGAIESAREAASDD